MGIGSTLLEQVGYSETGQSVTAACPDYLLSLLEDAPDIVQEHMPGARSQPQVDHGRQ
jgi:CO/xanthine dehydrogenase Mo-binding subunit